MPSRRLAGFATVSLPDSFAVDNAHVIFEELGEFDDLISVQASVDGTSGQGIAHQTSFIDPTGFTVSGDMRGSATHVDPEGFGEGFAQSLFEVAFTVDAPTDLQITGTLHQTGDDGQAFLSLLGPGQTILYLQTFTGTQTLAEGGFDVAASFEGGLAAPLVARSSDGPVVAPNPVRSFARILQPASGARFDEALVVDVAGRVVQRLEAHGDEMAWDTRDVSGARVPSGVYFLRFRSDESETVRRVQVLR